MLVRRRQAADRVEAAAAELSDAVTEAARADQAVDPDGLLPPNSLTVPRWFAVATVVVAVLFVPWIFYLAIGLPKRASTEHYDVLWVGFDLGMWTVIVALAVAALRRSTWTESLAVCAATFLVLDAWFDVVAADTTRQLISALLAAALLELPGAAACVWIARNAELIRRRAYDRLFALARGRQH